MIHLPGVCLENRKILGWKFCRELLCPYLFFLKKARLNRIQDMDLLLLHRHLKNKMHILRTALKYFQCLPVLHQELPEFPDSVFELLDSPYTFCFVECAIGLECTN